MSSIDSGSMGAYVSSVASYNSQNMGKTGKADAASSSEKTSDIQKTSEAGKKSSVSGKTIGSPKLSEKAARYYEQLKSKYSNMDFILVSADQKEQAKAQAGSYANANKMVVLIDEEKIEKMAEDENYRKQYEGIIANAATGLSSMSSKISATGASVKGFGMQVNDDGTASYFAVLKKSSAAQKQRIEKNAEKKKEAKKAEAKKAQKEAEKERLEKSKDKTGNVSDDDDDTVTITASSIDELLDKIQAQNQLFMSDNVQTEDEKKGGQKFDFSV